MKISILNDSITPEKEFCENSRKAFLKPLPPVFVERLSYITDYDNDGNLTQKRILTTVNLSYKINECSRLVKEDLAVKKLEELQKVLESTSFVEKE